MAEHARRRSLPGLGLVAGAFLPACASLPLTMSRRIGRVVGRTLAGIPSRGRQVTRLNLALCLPELDPVERERLVRSSLVHTTVGAFELGALWHWSGPRLARLEEETVGAELLDRATDDGRGVLLLLPHLGNWEVFNQLLIRRGPFTALYRPARIAEIDRVVRRSREGSGCTMAPATAGGVRQLLTALRQGGTVVILPDQEPPLSAGRFCPFFGVPALTMTLVGKLAQRCRAAVLLASALRTGGGFRIHFELAPTEIADLEADSLAALNHAVEGAVRRCPEQYLWSYKRFKTQPAGKLTPYRERSFSPANRHRLAEVVVERSPQLPKR